MQAVLPMAVLNIYTGTLKFLVQAHKASRGTSYFQPRSQTTIWARESSDQSSMPTPWQPLGITAARRGLLHERYRRTGCGGCRPLGLVYTVYV